jgi:hypothetical protein
MNKLTELFVEHCQRKSIALEAVEQLVEDLHKIDETDALGAQLAVFRYTGTIHREFMAWIATFDLQAAALKLQA